MKSMRTFAALVLVLALAPALLRAAGTEDKMEKSAKQLVKGNDVTAVLEANERKINDAVKAKDMTAFNALVDANGWMADPSGIMPASAMGDMMKEMEVRSYTIENFRAHPIDNDALVVTYEWKGDVSWKGQVYPPGPWYCSTVWAKRGKEWKAVYHQETLAMQPPAPAESH